MSFVRSSKFRHIFGQPSKEIFSGIKVTGSSDNSKFCAVNPKFVAIVTKGAGGGPFAVLRLEDIGRVSTSQPLVNGHTQSVIDVAWSPFDDNLIASASEDCTVKVWDIPDAGITETLVTPWVTLEGHQKKVTLLQWHPSAEFILASAGSDNKVIIWQVDKGLNVLCLDHPDIPTCISWNWNGSLIATTCKDKILRVFDARKQEVLHEKKKVFDGAKPSQCVFLKDGKIFAVGFSKMSSRLYSLYDLKKSQDPITSEEIDNGNGVLFLHYDPDNSIIFIAGKGDSNIRYYEINDQEPYVHFLTLYSTTASQRGFGWMPKRGLNVPACAIACCYKLTEDKCEPTNLVVPRKSELFQEDIFPPCVSDEKALTSDEWLSGKDADPKTMSMKPLFEQLKDSKGGVAKKSSKPRALAPRPSRQNDAGGEEVDLAKILAEMKKMQTTLSKVCKRIQHIEKKIGEPVSTDLE